MKKLNIEFIRAEFVKEGYILLTEVYENAHQRLEYVCPNGHQRFIIWDCWQRGQRCPCFSNKMKPTIEFIRADFAKEGYELLTEIYENSYQKLKYICSSPEKHRHSVTWSNWNSNKRRCPECSTIKQAEKLRLGIEFIRAEFVKEGYTLLTKTYEGSKQKLDYICPMGHKHYIIWNRWNSKEKHRCPFCNDTAKLNIEFIRAEFAKEGYILLTKVYKNAHQKLKYICPKGHKHSVAWSNWNCKRKCRCPFCNDTGVSKWEKMVKKFITESNIDYISNDKTQLINPETGRFLELDLWFPEPSKAIECNGLYWHSKKRAIKIDKVKQQLCKKQGIDLLVFTDKEWNSDIEKCKTDILSFLESGNKLKYSRSVQ